VGICHRCICRYRVENHRSLLNLFQFLADQIVLIIIAMIISIMIASLVWAANDKNTRAWIRMVLNRFAPVLAPRLEAKGIYWMTNSQRAHELRGLRENQRKEEKEIRQIRVLAKRYARTIIEGLTQRGIAYIRKDGNKFRIRRVRFDLIVIPSDRSAVYFHINGRRLPLNVGFELFQPKEVLEHMSYLVNREVMFESQIETGGWFIVGLGIGVRRIPTLYRWHESGSDTNVMDMLPKTKPMHVAIGMGPNKKLYYDDIRDWPHLLIGGATKWGKTSWIHQALATLVLRNDPEKLKLMLFDFKRIGLNIYKPLPHLAHPEYGFISDVGNAEDALTWLLNEMDHRFDLLEAEGVEDIEGYNYRRKRHRMPYILFVIDEVSDMFMHPDYGAKLRTRLEGTVLFLAQKGRAAGIFIWIGTQTPKAEIITTPIKYNLVARIAVNCSNNSASQIILDNKLAKGLAVKGRLIYQFSGIEGIELQAPFIERDQVHEIVKRLSSGQQVERAQVAVPPEKIFRYGLDNLGGALPIKRLFGKFKGACSRPYIINTMQEWEFRPADLGPIISLDSRQFIVLPGNGGRIPRRLHPVDSDGLPTDAAQLMKLIDSYVN